ncbi:MAG: hypothetical protein HZB68_04745 [Candidatus Aenigmarchaeota archaeon]|nr:hypothetical protein [Candidatus Aenigmarchaeota archaeon]
MKFIGVDKFMEKSSKTNATYEEKVVAKEAVIRAGGKVKEVLGGNRSLFGLRAVYYDWTEEKPYTVFQLDASKYDKEELSNLERMIPDKAKGYDVFYMLFDKPGGFAGQEKGCGSGKKCCGKCKGKC